MGAWIQKVKLDRFAVTDRCRNTLICRMSDRGQGTCYGVTALFLHLPFTNSTSIPSAGEIAHSAHSRQLTFPGSRAFLQFKQNISTEDLQGAGDYQYTRVNRVSRISVMLEKVSSCPVRDPRLKG